MIKPDSVYGPPAHMLQRRDPPAVNEFGGAQNLAPPEPQRPRGPVNFLDFDNGILLYKGVTVLLTPFQLREFKKLAAYFAINTLQEDLEDEPGPEEPKAPEASD